MRDVSVSEVDYTHDYVKVNRMLKEGWELIECAVNVNGQGYFFLGKPRPSAVAQGSGSIWDQVPGRTRAVNE